jgi:predicted RNA-binding Zn-ribbon protein involved in translation (DUF1610 family)
MSRRADEIVEIDFDYRDTLLTLACPACGARQVERLPSVMMVVEPRCTACGHVERLEPAAVAAASARLLPAFDLAGFHALDGEVAALVRGWTEVPGVGELLDYGGVALGDAALDLVPPVLRAVLTARREGR